MESTRENTTNAGRDCPATADSSQEAVARRREVMARRWQVALRELDVLVERLLQAEYTVRAACAQRHRAMAALSRHSAYRSRGDAAVEVACALNISERAAEGQVAEALTLTELFPEALDELGAGHIQVAQITALLKSTSTGRHGGARRTGTGAAPHGRAKAGQHPQGPGPRHQGGGPRRRAASP